MNSLNNIPKTLVLVPDLNIAGGVSNYYKTLRLDQQHNITYFTINNFKKKNALIAILILVFRYILFSIKLLRHRYELIVLNPSLDEGKSFHREMFFILISHLLKRKTLVFFRGWFDPYEQKIIKSKLKSFLFNLSYAKVDKYIVLGNIFKNKLIGLGVPSSTEFFIETTVADSSFMNDFDMEKKFNHFNDQVNFLFLSRIEKEKGIYIAIDAFNEFLKSNPGIKSSLVIAGDGPDLPSVKKYVSEKNISQIEFLGHVSKESKKKVLLESHIMIFPSFTEGLPNCILEGMLYGMPIISRSTGGIPEIVIQNVNGFISDSFQSSIYMGFLSIIALDKNLYERIAKTNHQIAMDRYTSEKVKERILKIYETFNHPKERPIEYHALT